MSLTTYRIANWNTKYENNRSREIVNAEWFPCPNVFDGDGYCYMIDGKDGPLAYCGWILLCGVASRCNPRGILVQTTGHPHTPKTIAAKTGVSIGVINLAIERALFTRWLEPHDGAASSAPIPHPPAGLVSGTCEKVRSLPREPNRTEPEGEQIHRSGGEAGDSAAVDSVGRSVGSVQTPEVGKMVRALGLNPLTEERVLALPDLTGAEINEVVESVTGTPGIRKIPAVVAKELLGRRGIALGKKAAGSLSLASLTVDVPLSNIEALRRNRRPA